MQNNCFKKLRILYWGKCSVKLRWTMLGHLPPMGIYRFPFRSCIPIKSLWGILLTVFIKFLYMICLLHFSSRYICPCCIGHPMVETGMQFLSNLFYHWTVGYQLTWLRMDCMIKAVAPMLKFGVSIWIERFTYGSVPAHQSASAHGWERFGVKFLLPTRLAFVVNLIY